MGLITVLKSLLGSGASPGAADQPAADSIDYKGFQISPAPIKNGHMYRVAATISKDEETHQLIRADEMADRQTCIDVSLRKARDMIDQQGDNIFSR